MYDRAKVYELFLDLVALVALSIGGAGNILVSLGPAVILKTRKDVQRLGIYENISIVVVNFSLVILSFNILMNDGVDMPLS
mmetsp:Transcript_10783/g.15209  ORF Transcript_10783/g.15209 Transcript_10783/m.15209 type:complete len:81 (-) Transcript_10783:8-250(-)